MRVLPSSLLAIDPGECTGWAFFDNYKLRACGVDPGTTPDGLSYTDIVAEKPQVYPRSPVPPNDLITLAVSLGRYVERWKKSAHAIHYVAPRQWKGTINPDILCARVFDSLSEPEKTIVAKAGKGIAPGKRHNMLDAIGLGAWYLQRSA